jgi:hypothetical protein
MSSRGSWCTYDGPKKTDVTAWAMGVHDHLIRYTGFPPGAAYLLIGFPDLFCFWPADAVRDPDHPPVHQAMDPGVLSVAGSCCAKDREARERVVADWLAEVVSAPPDTLAGPAAWLAATGLLDDVRGGSIKPLSVAARPVPAPAVPA